MKKILKIFLIMLFIIPVYNVNAQTLQQMYNQLAELEKQQAKVNSGKKLTSSQINNLKVEINNLSASITNTENEIEKATNEIKDSEKKIEQKKEETDQMLLYLQLSSGQGDSLLEYVLKLKIIQILYIDMLL